MSIVMTTNGKKPNVLLLLSDEHNAKCLGAAGQGQVRTPNLDCLAERGVTFSRAYCQSPICTPSRISLASGQYPHNHGYYGLAGDHVGPDLLDRLPHVFGHFKEGGYRVGAVGKIHLPHGWVDRSCDRLTIETDASRGYAAYLTGRGISIARSGAVGWSDRLKQFDGPKWAHDFGPDQLGYDDSLEKWEAQQAVEFMRDCGNAPFFLQVGFKRPHTPCVPSPEFWELYPDEELQEPPNADYDMALKSPLLRRRRELLEAIPPEQFVYEPRTYVAARRRYLRGYLGCISQVDHAIGEVLEFLELSGFSENTIVVYTSDHGDYACEHGLIEKAPGICADAVTRTPFIWCWPREFASGVTCHQLIESVDLAPTLCALAGLGPMPTADGQDLSDLLRGGSRPVRSAAVTENPWSRSIRTERYRLVHYHPDLFEGQRRGDLYDLENDPWEMRNLYAAPDYQGVRLELCEELANWLLKTTRVVSPIPPSTVRVCRAAKGVASIWWTATADAGRSTSARFSLRREPTICDLASGPDVM